jgi:hypothetical protein
MVTTVEQINIFIVLVSFPFLWQNQLEGRKLYFGSVSEVSVQGRQNIIATGAYGMV